MDLLRFYDMMRCYKESSRHFTLGILKSASWSKGHDFIVTPYNGIDIMIKLFKYRMTLQ